MELYFQEKLSFKGKVEITDAEGKVIYTGKKGFWSGELILKNAEGKKVLAIGETAGLFNKRFVIHKKRKKIATMKKKLSIIGNKLHIKKLEWDVKGDFITREYTITKGSETIAQIKKKKLISLLEGYSIDVKNEAEVENVVAVCLVLNQILKNKKAKLLKK